MESDEKYIKIKVSWVRNCLVVIGIILCELILFRGFLDYGVQFDEVYRKCNVFSIFSKNSVDFNQAIYSVNFLGKVIPIMYKPYISSATIIPWIPVLFFSNPLIGIRVLYYLYLVIGLVCIYYIFYNERKIGLGLIIVALIAFNPILYPYIRYGWASAISFISLAAIYKLIFLYKKNNKRIVLFWVSFIITMDSYSITFRSNYFMAKKSYIIRKRYKEYLFYYPWRITRFTSLYII